MIEQQGQVVSVSRNIVSVRLGGYSGCPACDAGKGCGAGVFSRLLNRKPVVLELEDTIGSRVGQAVIIGLPETLLLRLAVRFYLMPLLAGLAGAAVGHYITGRFTPSEAMGDGASLIGAIAAGSGVLFFGRKRKTEFPATNAVHLLRRTDQFLTEPCAGQISK